MKRLAVSVHQVALDIQQRLFVFDFWVRNEDRTFTEFGGNPNLFLSAPELDPVVIDHNLAFDPDFDLVNNRELHVCRDAWAGAKGDLVLPLQLRATMTQLLSTLETIKLQLPDVWLDAAPEAFGQMTEILQQCATDEFWDALNE